MKHLLIGIIILYQKTLSPDHGFGRALYPYAGCKFYPTCSMYTREAIAEHGAWYGMLLGIKRIGRCHPFTNGGIDVVPKPKHHG